MPNNNETYNGLNNHGDTTCLYPYTSFTNAGVSVCDVKCDQTNIKDCQYVQFLKQRGYNDLIIKEIGRITLVELHFYINWSSKELNLPYPAMFCKNCPWNRAR